MLKENLQRHPLLRRLLLPVFACALWGSAFPAVKVGFTYFEVVDMPTRVAFAGLRFVLAGLMLLLVPGKAELFRKAPKRLLFAAAL